jgi:hypothetical protein
MAINIVTDHPLCRDTGQTGYKATNQLFFGHFQGEKAGRDIHHLKKFILPTLILSRSKTSRLLIELNNEAGTA